MLESDWARRAAVNTDLSGRKGRSDTTDGVEVNGAPGLKSLDVSHPTHCHQYVDCVIRNEHSGGGPRAKGKGQQPAFCHSHCYLKLLASIPYDQSTVKKKIYRLNQAACY